MADTFPALVCDEMLKGLGRWLRAAGYDTCIAEGQSDRELIAETRSSGRILLTRDRKMAEFRHADECVLVLAANSLGACVSELKSRLAIDWLLAPFSRCLCCNRPLLPARPGVHDRVPASVLRENRLFWRCPDCGRLYWQGSHVRRMRTRLEQWARVLPPGCTRD
jgi:uncharacterized protein with PIN domain